MKDIRVENMASVSGREKRKNWEHAEQRPQRVIYILWDRKILLGVMGSRISLTSTSYNIAMVYQNLFIHPSKRKIGGKKEE